MYFAQQYEWHTVLSFHGAVLLEIEHSLLNWGDSFIHLESRTLYSHLKSSTNTYPRKSAMPILFCRDYQRQQCTHSQDHFGYIRGNESGYGIFVQSVGPKIDNKNYTGKGRLIVLYRPPLAHLQKTNSVSP